jgi:hypothetical protein
MSISDIFILVVNYFLTILQAAILVRFYSFHNFSMYTCRVYTKSSYTIHIYIRFRDCHILSLYTVPLHRPFFCTGLAGCLTTILTEPFEKISGRQRTSEKYLFILPRNNFTGAIACLQSRDFSPK